MTDKEIPTVPASQQLRALAEDVMRCDPRPTASDDDTHSEWLEMAADRLAQAVIENGDSSLLTVLAEHYIKHLMGEEHAKSLAPSVDSSTEATTNNLDTKDRDRSS
jgi:hypothetical protein